MLVPVVMLVGPDPMPGDFAFGLVEIPVDEPADFGALHRVLGEQPLVALQDAARLVEIFGDHRCADDRHVALGQQDRQRAGRVQRQELLAPGPRLFLDQSQLLAILAESEADEATGGEHGMMEKRQHGSAMIKRTGVVELKFLRPQWYQRSGTSNPNHTRNLE